MIASLLEKAEISATEAPKLVGAGSLDDLTGGRAGTASELIDRLQEKIDAGE